ncbi:MAG TPA: hypothetical protein VNF50_01245 [Acidimicrobiales bacterium]|nr:hypothetical protein [Acidimicrobiales bacterium]
MKAPVYFRQRGLRAGAQRRSGPIACLAVAEDLDVQAMIERFRERSRAVRNRGVPPIEGPERKRFIEAAQLDFQDFAMLGDAQGSMEDGVLVLRIDLRPPEG